MSKALIQYKGKDAGILEEIQRSFLSEELKESYINLLRRRINI